MSDNTQAELRKWLVNNYFFFQHLDCAAGEYCGHRVHADDKLQELADFITSYTNTQIEQVLDRLEESVKPADDFDGAVHVVKWSRIEAERKRLKGGE